MRKLAALILLLLAASLVTAQAKDPLRHDGETTIFAFQMADSPKWASLCESSESGSPYIVYRYGLAKGVELEFPQDLSESWQSFEYSYYLRGGGASNEGQDLNYVSFQNGDWKYVVYQEYSADTDTTSVGIRLTNARTGRKVDLHGNAGSIQGSLVPLRDEDRITRGEVSN
jgi:hypothetical protein